MGEPVLTTVETVNREGSWVFTIEDTVGQIDEAILVPCEDGDEPVRAWINRCMHEDQRLHRAGIGAAIRDGLIVCPRHGSMFDTCSGKCDNGEAAGTRLIELDIEVRDESIVLTDDTVELCHPGPEDDDDDGPQSTSHIQF